VFQSCNIELGVVTHAYDFSMWEAERERGIMSSRPAWALQQVSGANVGYETLPQNIKKENVYNITTIQILQW
jgi:hypothetical protein